MRFLPRARRATLCAVLLLGGCPKEEAAQAPAAETVSPKDSPYPYRVLSDSTDNNAVEFHVLVAETIKHEEMEKLLRYLYRHLMQRREDEPASLAAYVYTSEAAWKSPPRAPVGQLIRRGGDNGPKFEDKVPLSFWQEVDEALHPQREGEPDDAFEKRRNDEKKRKLQIAETHDEVKKSVVVTWPYTDDGKDWVPTLGYNQAMNAFTDTAIALFEGSAELTQLDFKGVWKDKEVVTVSLDREGYKAADPRGVEEKIGQHHGRVFLELALNKNSDDKAAKDNAARIASEYKAMLGKLKGKAKVDAALK